MAVGGCDAGRVSGDVVVIAALVNDTRPENQQVLMCRTAPRRSKEKLTQRCELRVAVGGPLRMAGSPGRHSPGYCLPSKTLTPLESGEQHPGTTRAAR